MSAGRVVSYLPRSELHVVWHDRRQRAGTVILVADRRPVALNDRFFAREIPRWQRLGIAAGLRVYAGVSE